MVHGPNLNLLGRREPQIYGMTTLDQINGHLAALAKELNVELVTMQSNSEGVIVDTFQKHMDDVQGALINGAGLTFSSVSIHDVIKAVPFPVIEVHISNLGDARRDSPQLDFDACGPGRRDGSRLAIVHGRPESARRDRARGKGR